MTSRQPPSQRNRTSIEHAVRHNSRGLLSQGGPGFLAGRFATAQPIPGGSWVEMADDSGSDGPESDQPLWENGDVYVVGVADVAVGSIEVALSYSDIVEKSVQVVCHGLVQPAESFTVDLAAGVVFIPLESHDTAGTLFEFHYQHFSGPRNYEPVSTILVASRSLSGTQSSIALPTGTASGDLVVVGLVGWNAASCSDSRFRQVSGVNIGRPAGVWVGYADDALSAVQIQTTADSGHAYGQFVISTAATFRNSDGSPLRWDPEASFATPSSSSTTALIPGISDSDIGGAICAFNAMDGIGGVYGDQDWSKAPAYSLVASLDNSYVEVDYAYCNQSPVPAQTTPNIDDGNWSAAVIALRGRGTA